MYGMYDSLTHGSISTLPYPRRCMSSHSSEHSLASHSPGRLRRKRSCGKLPAPRLSLLLLLLLKEPYFTRPGSSEAEASQELLLLVLLLVAAAGGGGGGGGRKICALTAAAPFQQQ